MKKTKLLNAIKRGETEITEVSLRKPDVGALRGLKLGDILMMDVSTLSALLPRLTEPALLPAEIATMDPADFMTLAGTVVSFFASEEQRLQIAATGRQH